MLLLLFFCLFFLFYSPSLFCSLFVCALFSQCKSNVTQCKEIENVHFNPINVFGLMHVCTCQCVCVCVLYLHVCALYVHRADITRVSQSLNVPHCGNGNDRITNQLMTLPALHQPYPCQSPPPLLLLTIPATTTICRISIGGCCCMTNCSQLWQNIGPQQHTQVFFFFLVKTEAIKNARKTKESKREGETRK